MILIESEGALLRGPSRAWPAEIWHATKKVWLPYMGVAPKPIEWGNVVDEEKAREMLGDAGRQSGARS